MQNTQKIALLLAGLTTLVALVVSTRIPDAQRVDALPPEEADRILETMAAKYGERMTAADVYYVLLASPRDRVALVVKLLQA